MKWRIFVRKLIHILILISLCTTPVFAEDEFVYEIDYEFDAIYLPFMLDGRYIGDINTVPMDEETTQIDMWELASYLEGRVAEDKLQAVRDYPEQWAELGELTDLPVIIQFNMFDLVIEAFIPAANTVAKQIILAGTAEPLDYPILEPAEFSFYMNINSSLTLESVDGYANDDTEASAPFSTNFYPSVNYKGWTLETSAQISSNTTGGILWGDIQITKDWPELPLKLMLGDISYNTVENQSSPSYIGAVVTRDLDRAFYQKSYSRFTRSLLVPEDNSLVTILLNNRTATVLDLEAGMYTVSDFFFSNGINDITFAVETAEEVTVEDFLFAYDSSLTSPGQTEYTFGIGLPTDTEGMIPEVFGNQIFGVSNHISGNYFFQLGSNQQNLGTSGIFSTLLGNFQLGTAVSHTADSHMGYYTSLRYYYGRAISKASRSFSLSAGYTSPFYNSFNNSETATEVEQPLSLTASYGQSLFENMGFSISTSATLNTDYSFYSSRINASLRAKPFQSLSVSAAFIGSWEYPEDSTELSFSPTASLSFSYSPDDSNASYSYNQSLTDTDNSLSVSFQPEQLKGIAAFSGSMSNFILDDDPLPSSLSVGGSYTHKDYLLSGDIVIGRGSTEVSYSAELGISTAISYAEGLFGISHPIGDCFAMISLESPIEDYVLGVGSLSSGYNARTDEFGAGVITGLSSFAEQSIGITAIEIPPGLEMGPDRFAFSPTYHQAGVLRFGTEANVSVLGKMYFSDGTPVALYSGEVKKKGASPADGEEPNYFFTYTDGTYELYGLNSGEYIVTLYIGDGLRLDLSIPKGLKGELYTKDLIIPVRYKDF